MFSSCMVQDLNDFGPLFPLLFHKGKYLVILFIFPFSFVLLAVKVVQPSLSAMFGSFKNKALRVEKEGFGNLVPLSYAFLVGGRHQK